MTDLATIKQVAQITQDAEGHEVVLIPRALWEAFVEDLEQRDVPQHERIKALLRQWENEPDDTPPEWWEEFDRFLRENRFQIGERDLKLDEP